MTFEAGTRTGGSLDVIHGTEALAEADRLMTICNSCRYCEGLCAVFPAMEMRRSFADADLNYLANLCHSCGACHVDCQFSPPHEFQVNVPRTLAVVRHDSYARYAWPRSLAPLFQKNGLKVSLIAAASVALFILGFVGFGDPAVLWQAQEGPGAFFRLMPHNAMVALFGAACLYAILALGMSMRAFWRDASGLTSAPIGLAAFWQAMRDAGSLRYLDGGGDGCGDGRAADPRKHAHHATFYGFLLCFAATSVATLYHYLLGREAPYPWWDLPVVLGTLGGLGLIVGPAGLLMAKATRDPELEDQDRSGMAKAFIVMLLLTSVTGMLLLLLRSSAAMGIFLALHLGVVFALFVTMPYSKFVHGLFRFLALVRHAADMRRLQSGAD